MRRVVALFAPLLAVSCALMSTSAAADLIEDLNALRAKGCRGHKGAPTPLQPSRELDAVAREWSNGGRLRDALSRSGYRAVNSASMHIEGAPDGKLLLKAIADNYCDTVTDPTFTAVGFVQRARDVHIVVALPFAAPSAGDASAMSARVLALVNQARAKPRRCGNQGFSAAPPLSLSATLSRAALLHSQDMAKNNFFEHQGSDGSTVAVRATRVGYDWRSIGENIAAGPTTAETVVTGWLESPGHCANIMGQNFTEMGLAYANATRGNVWIYWTQVLGSRSKK